MKTQSKKVRGLVEVPGGYYDVAFEPLDKGGYLARVPALKSTTFGKSLEDAQTMVADMVAGWLAVAHEDGLPIPIPKRLVHIKPQLAIAL